MIRVFFLGSAARDAFVRAVDPACRFAWGEAEAGQLLGQALTANKRFDEARQMLTFTARLQREIGDPRASKTEQLLVRLPG